MPPHELRRSVTLAFQKDARGQGDQTMIHHVPGLNVSAPKKCVVGGAQFDKSPHKATFGTAAVDVGLSHRSGWDYNAGVMRSLQIAAFLAALLAAGGLSTYSQREIPKDLAITLKRSMCFGWCPAYTLTMTANGFVKFTPTGAYAYRGDGVTPSFPLTGSITADQLSALLTEFEKIKFYSLRNHYGRSERSNGGPSCPKSSTDNPSADITVVRNGKRKSVGHYLGCKGAKILDDLAALENKIDKIANTEQWTSQFGWGVGSVVDLKLQVNHLNSSTPEKP